MLSTAFRANRWAGRNGRLLLTVFFLASLLLVDWLLPWSVPATTAAAVNSCSSPVNISNSPGYTSVDPLMLSDEAGRIHLFWAERMTGEPGASPNVPDTLVYTVWQNGRWSDPIDLFISPPENFNARIGAIRGVVDENGRIHLVWIGPDNTFFYSSAYSFEATNANAWLPPVLLADDQSGTQYSVAIAHESPDIIHVIYGKDPARANRTVAYIRSLDNGRSWSEPVDIHAFPDVQRGASNTRLLVHEPNRIYATWTEWDETGNGQVIYFARSLDSGLNWERPIPLAVRVGIEYQRDWTAPVILDDETLAVFWSGGFRAYPQSQYSHDGGVTWSEPHDTLYWLIADNGPAQFIQDNQGNTHLFIARRIREGYAYKCPALPGCQGDGDAIWHSTWLGGTSWSEPQPVGGFQFSNYVSVAYDGGDRLFLSWFVYGEFDIFVMDCRMSGLSQTTWQEYPTRTPQPTATPPQPSAADEVGPTRPLIDSADLLAAPDSLINTQPDTGNVLLLSITPSLMILLAVVFLKRRRDG